MTVLRVIMLVTLLFEVIGAAVSVLLLVDSRRDLRVVHQSQIRNGRRMVAQATTKTEALRFGTMLSLVIASALMTFILWDITIGDASIEVLGAVFAVDLAVALLVAQSIGVYMMRRRLFDGYRDKLGG